MTNKLYFDTSAALEILFIRQHLSFCQSALEKYNSHISFLTAHQIMYFGQKAKLTQVEIKEFLSLFTILPSTATQYHKALQLIPVSDFEDTLQINCAQEHGFDLLISCDKEFINQSNKYKIEILHPY